MNFFSSGNLQTPAKGIVILTHCVLKYTHKSVPQMNGAEPSRKIGIVSLFSIAKRIRHPSQEGFQPYFLCHDPCFREIVRRKIRFLLTFFIIYLHFEIYSYTVIWHTFQNYPFLSS